VPDGVDPTVERDEQAAAEASVDRGAVHAPRRQLTPRDDPVLPFRQPRQQHINRKFAALSSHSEV
jgi:hypothetical protein